MTLVLIWEFLTLMIWASAQLDRPFEPGYLPFTWKHRKFRLENHVVRAIPFGKPLKYRLRSESNPGALTSTTATAVKTSVLKRIPFFQTLSRLFQFAENGKCRRISLELISWGPHSSLEREKEIRRRLFTSSIKLAIRHFHVVVVQGR